MDYMTNHGNGWVFLVEKASVSIRSSLAYLFQVINYLQGAVQQKSITKLKFLQEMTATYDQLDDNEKRIYLLATSTGFFLESDAKLYIVDESNQLSLSTLQRLSQDECVLVESVADEVVTALK